MANKGKLALLAGLGVATATVGRGRVGGLVRRLRGGNGSQSDGGYSNPEGAADYVARSQTEWEPASRGAAEEAAAESGEEGGGQAGA